MLGLESSFCIGVKEFGQRWNVRVCLVSACSSVLAKALKVAQGGELWAYGFPWSQLGI